MFFIINKFIKKIKRKVKEFITYTVSLIKCDDREQWIMGGWRALEIVKVGDSGQCKVKGQWEVWVLMAMGNLRLMFDRKYVGWWQWLIGGKGVMGKMWDKLK